MKTDAPRGCRQLKAAYARVARKLPREATDHLVEHLDALLAGNELTRVRTILERIETTRLPPGVLTGVLSLTWHAREALADARTGFFERVMQALETTWEVSEDRRRSIAERLR